MLLIHKFNKLFCIVEFFYLFIHNRLYLALYILVKNAISLFYKKKINTIFCCS